MQLPQCPEWSHESSLGLQLYSFTHLQSQKVSALTADALGTPEVASGGLIGRELLYTCIWQSQVENEHYSVLYFDRVTVFKGLIHVCEASTRMSPALEVRNTVF